MDTLSEVHSIIREAMMDEAEFSFINRLYGLFDGYLYNDLLESGEVQLSRAVYRRLEVLVNEVSKYPTL
jgi:hypothetical protein